MEIAMPETIAFKITFDRSELETVAHDMEIEPIDVVHWLLGDNPTYQLEEIK
jgi:hypothetical protein